MSRHAHQPAALRRRVFLGREAVASGLLSPRQLRGPAWQRLLRGVYADARLARDHDLMVHAASLIIPPSAAITESPPRGSGALGSRGRVIRSMW